MHWQEQLKLFSVLTEWFIKCEDIRCSKKVASPGFDIGMARKCMKVMVTQKYVVIFLRHHYFHTFSCHTTYVQKTLQSCWPACMWACSQCETMLTNVLLEVEDFVPQFPVAGNASDSGEPSRTSEGLRSIGSLIASNAYALLYINFSFM